VQRADPQTASGKAVVIAFDPANWRGPAQPEQRRGDVVLFGLFLDAVRIATGAMASDSAAEDAPELQSYLRERTPSL
jgi:hypothetical protein